ncbi:MAG: PAS domain-containing protein, partial [Endomicrobium sp.]|nr:PAS domain-containing protein [Endomicrobium sp.]
MTKKPIHIHIDNVMQSILGYIYWKDVNGVYLGCNQMEAELANLNSPNDIVGKTDYDLPWKQNAKTLIETDQRILKNKLSEELIELVIVDGKTVIMLTKKSPLYDDKNNVIGIVGVSIDITDRKASEELQEIKLRRKQSYMESVLQHIPVPIYWKSLNGIYLGCNQEEVNMLGLKSPKDIVGKTDYELSWKCIADVLRETDQRIMSTLIPESIIELPKLANGKDAIMLTKKSPLYDSENNVIGIIGVSIDITERKRAEELQKKLEIQEE